MKVSIITAVFNGGNSIVPTLKSVAEQDYADIEHIVVDGASTDQTLSNVQVHGKRVAVLISEADGGVYDAFNKGLRCVTGDVVAFLNCGDVYASPVVVSGIVNELIKKDVPAVFADVSIVDVNDPVRVVRRYTSKHFLPTRMCIGLMPAHPTLFVRREVYRSVGLYDTSFRIAGDFEMCVRIFVQKRTAYSYIANPLVRMPTGGLSNRGWRSKWEITREMLRACRQNGISTNLTKLSLRFPLKMLELC